MNSLHLFAFALTPEHGVIVALAVALVALAAILLNKQLAFGYAKLMAFRHLAGAIASILTEWGLTPFAKVFDALQTGDAVEFAAEVKALAADCATPAKALAFLRAMLLKVIPTQVADPTEGPVVIKTFFSALTANAAALNAAGDPTTKAVLAALAALPK
jgi:hypothetical protein